MSESGGYALRDREYLLGLATDLTEGAKMARRTGVQMAWDHKGDAHSRCLDDGRVLRIRDTDEEVEVSLTGSVHQRKLVLVTSPRTDDGRVFRELVAQVTSEALPQKSPRYVPIER